MPNLSTQEVNEFLAIKEDVIKVWEECKIKPTQREIPKGLDNKRVDPELWINENFNDEQIEKLLALKSLFKPIVAKLWSSDCTDTTKIKKTTVYRRMIAEFIQDKEYNKNSYNKLPYILFPTDKETTTKVNQKDAKRVREENRGDNRIPLTLDIINQMIKKAINDLKKPAENAKDYASKCLALELLLGRRQYSEIMSKSCHIELRDDNTFLVQGLAKSTIEKKERSFICPFLGSDYDKNIKQLIKDNLKIVRDYAEEKSQKKTPLIQSMYSSFVQAGASYDNILKPVRDVSKLEPIIGNTHLLRKFYAFICYVLIDKRRSNESQYFAEILVHGDRKEDGEFLTQDTTAKSYSIFYLADKL